MRLAVGPEDRRLDRNDLPVEAALRPRGPGQRLGPQAERVGLLAGQAAAYRDALGADVLVRQVDVPRRGPRRADVRADRGPQRDPAHRLDPAGDPDADRVRRDEAGHQVGGLLRRAALGVQGQAAAPVRQPGVQPGRPGDVAGLLARLGHAPACYLFYLGRGEARAVEQRGLDATQELGRVHSGQRTAALSDRGPGRLDDHCPAHGSPLHPVV